MRIVLRDDVDNLGKKGDLVDVAALLPNDPDAPRFSAA